MDEREFKKTYAEFNEQPCAFAKALLKGCAGCSRAQRVFIAEREAMACHSPAGRGRCLALLDHLRHNALFALRQTHLDGPLPHGKEMKVQCGGILGLDAALDQRESERVSDVNALVEAAVDHWGSLEALPYSQLAQSIVRYRPRSLSSHRHSP